MLSATVTGGGIGKAGQGSGGTKFGSSLGLDDSPFRKNRHSCETKLLKSLLANVVVGTASSECFAVSFFSDFGFRRDSRTSASLRKLSAGLGGVVGCD